MKDYVFEVKEIQPFREALRIEAENGSKWAYLDETNSPKLNVLKTGIIPYSGVKTVSIVRLTIEQKEWGEQLPGVTFLGEAKEQYIKEESDINWTSTGKTRYHNIFKQDKITREDEDGNTYEVAPPLLHCVLAS